MIATIEDSFQYIDQIPDGNLIEFGVYHADALSRIMKRRKFIGVWGFDSFCGLPPKAELEGNPDWKEHSFDICRDDGFATPEDAKKFIREKCGRKDINLVEGWFENTLTYDLGMKLCNTASYVNVDCDLYSSSITCLNWLFKYQIMKCGGLIRYDDFAYGYSQGIGQVLAHRRMSVKYNINLISLYSNVFILESYS